MYQLVVVQSKLICAKSILTWSHSVCSTQVVSVMPKQTCALSLVVIVMYREGSMVHSVCTTENVFHTRQKVFIAKFSHFRHSDILVAIHCFRQLLPRYR